MDFERSRPLGPHPAPHGEICKLPFRRKVVMSAPADVLEDVKGSARIVVDVQTLERRVCRVAMRGNIIAETDIAIVFPRTSALARKSGREASLLTHVRKMVGMKYIVGGCD